MNKIVDSAGKEPMRYCRRHKRGRLNPWMGKIPWRRGSPPGNPAGVATHSSIPAWETPWTEEPCGLQSRESESNKACMHTIFSKFIYEHSGSQIQWVIPYIPVETKCFQSKIDRVINPSKLMCFKKIKNSKNSKKDKDKCVSRFT